MLTQLQADALTEIVNIGMGRAGSVLSELVGSTVKLHIPDVGIYSLPELRSSTSLAEETELASVRQQFSGSLAGRAVLLFPRESGNTLARELIGDDPEITSIDSEREAALTEVGNILLNSVLGCLSNALHQQFSYDVPVYREGPLDNLLSAEAVSPEDSDEEQRVLYAKAHFDIEAFRITGNVFIIFGTPSFRQLLAEVDRMTFEEVS